MVQLAERLAQGLKKARFKQGLEYSALIVIARHWKIHLKFASELLRCWKLNKEGMGARDRVEKYQVELQKLLAPSNATQ